MTWQRVLLDRLRRGSYIGAGVGAVVLACRPRLAPLVPDALGPAEPAAATAWAAATWPRRATAVQFRWRYGDGRSGFAGRGTARLAPPDSLRVDFRGPLGYSGAAVVVGDSVVWSEPRGDLDGLLGGVPLLWAALGAVRPPAAGSAVYGGTDPAGARWRFVTGADTLEYRAQDGPARVLEAEWRRDGRVRARSRTEYGTDTMPASARIDFPEAAARFELSVVARDTLVVFPPALWRRR